MEFVPSKYQENIFAFVNQESGHAVIEAVAGSGKTTTLVKIMEQIPSNQRVLFVAFNNHIVDELKKRAPAHADVSTLHQLGLRTLRHYGKGLKTDTKKLDKILEAALLTYNKPTMYEMKYPMGKIIGYLKNTGRRASTQEIIEVCRFYRADMPINVLPDDVYNTYVNGDSIDPWYMEDVITAVNRGQHIIPMSRFYKLITACFDTSISDTATVDFDDMVYLPYLLDLKLGQYDAVLGDEAQDYNTPQIDLLTGAIRQDGRILAVGDRFQSIYGFRGANVDSIPILIESLKAEVLPLSISYRCPRTHVALAQKIVPHLECAENATEGKIYDIIDSEIRKLVVPGDMLICRYNAPLVHVCIQLIADGKRAIVKGRNVAATIQTMLRKFKTNDLSEVRVKLQAWYSAKMKLCQETNADPREYKDRYDTINELICGLPQCKTVQDIVDYIDSIFSDRDTTCQDIVLSSIHKVKGLEAKRVFIIYPNLMPSTRKGQQEWEYAQELNTLYVALTRSTDTIFMVYDPFIYEARRSFTWIYKH